MTKHYVAADADTGRIVGYTSGDAAPEDNYGLIWREVPDNNLERHKTEWLQPMASGMMGGGTTIVYLLRTLATMSLVADSTTKSIAAGGGITFSDTSSVPGLFVTVDGPQPSAALYIGYDTSFVLDPTAGGEGTYVVTFTAEGYADQVFVVEFTT